MVKSAKMSSMTSGDTIEDLVKFGNAFDAEISKVLSNWSPSISMSACFFKSNMDINIRSVADINNNEEWKKAMVSLGLKKLFVRIPGDKLKRGKPRKPLNKPPNCVPVTFESLDKDHNNGSPICANIFRTGVNVVGVIDFSAFELAFTVVKTITSMAHGFIGKDPPIFLNWTFGTMNIVINMGGPILIDDLCSVLSDKGYRCLYNRNSYSALRVKFTCGGLAEAKEKAKNTEFLAKLAKGDYSCMNEDDDDSDGMDVSAAGDAECIHSLNIFPSGKIILANIKNPRDLATYNDVLQIINGMKYVCDK